MTKLCAVTKLGDLTVRYQLASDPILIILSVTVMDEISEKKLNSDTVFKKLKNNNWFTTGGTGNYFDNIFFQEPQKWQCNK